MTKQRQATGNRLANPATRPADNTFPARGFPTQREIHKLEEALDALNERIAELEGEGHFGRAMKVLRTNALDFARRIDELRSLLVDPALKDKTKPS